MKNKNSEKYIFDDITYNFPFSINYNFYLGQPQTIQEVFINALIQRQTIWATSYGRDKHEPWAIREIELNDVTYYDWGYVSLLGSHGPSFTWVWGGPGPDYNVYSLADYGKTWAFTKEELITKENYEATKKSFDYNGKELAPFEEFFKEEE